MEQRTLRTVVEKALDVQIYLGIPTVSDRIAQQVVKSRLEPMVDGAAMGTKVSRLQFYRGSFNDGEDCSGRNHERAPLVPFVEDAKGSACCFETYSGE